jgi:hypothetical protein
VLRDTADGGYVTKDGPISPRKIDAAIAAVVAHDRAVWNVHNQPAEQVPLIAFI